MSHRYDLWAPGFVMVPRGLLDSDFWDGLKPAYRSVVFALWNCANYVPGEFQYGAQAVRVRVPAHADHRFLIPPPPK